MSEQVRRLAIRLCDVKSGVNRYVIQKSSGIDFKPLLANDLAGLTPPIFSGAGRLNFRFQVLPVVFPCLARLLSSQNSPRIVLSTNLFPQQFQHILSPS